MARCTGLFLIKVHTEWKEDWGTETKQRTIIHAADGQRALSRDRSGGEIQKRAIILSRGGFFLSEEEREVFENVSIMRSSESPQNWPRNDGGDDDDLEVHEPKQRRRRSRLPKLWRGERDHLWRD